MTDIPPITIRKRKTYSTRTVQGEGSAIILGKNEEFDWQSSYLDLRWAYVRLERKYKRVPSWFITLNNFVRRLY